MKHTAKRTSGGIKLQWTKRPLSSSASDAAPAPEFVAEPESPAAPAPTSPASPTFPNEYTGFHPPLDGSWSVPRVRLADTTPESFFASYVATRTPCVLVGDAAWARPMLEQWASLEYLAARAGKQKVMVEEAGSDGIFGTAKARIPSTFSDFLATIRTSPHRYLTTQYAAESDDDESDNGPSIRDVFPAPLPALATDFPWIPPILPTLIPQQLNLWLGSTRSGGASSGLHHDFADNLYVLIRGRKRFTLFSPRDAGNLHLHGDVARVAKNGLIVYEEGIRDDGAFDADVARWRVDRAQAELARVERESPEDMDALERAEAELDEAMLAQMQAGGGGMDDDDDEDDEEEGGSFFGNGGSDADSDDDGSIPDPALLADGAGDDDFDALFSDTESEPKRAEPPSFSQIAVSTLHPTEHPSTLTPPPPSTHLAGLAASSRATVTLAAGEMLYLPSSWFHEVTSESPCPGDVHVAMNYWMHPPTTGEFRKPYGDEYWADQWDVVRRKMERAVAKAAGGKKRGRDVGDRDGGRAAAGKKAKKQGGRR
ncbi:hypothetical protein H9P43_007914 [Blastocladiella emersonii ATCC 22665]|nr:hypothetical protein H9P43_007914 [Blastocladiella emersonii ATCC 22665]